MNFDPRRGTRGTGRTTRMMVAARDAARKGRNVFVVFANARLAQEWREPGLRTIEANCAYEVIVGTSAPLVFLDHALAPESVDDFCRRFAEVRK